MFVHGGISPTVAPLGAPHQRAGQPRADRGSDKTVEAPLVSLTARVDGPLWYRGLAQETEAFAPQIDEILAKAQARAIVVGHTVTPTGRGHRTLDGRVIQIDTGMQPAYAQGGRASALEIAPASHRDLRRPPRSVPLRRFRRRRPPRLVRPRRRRDRPAVRPGPFTRSCARWPAPSTTWICRRSRRSRRRARRILRVLISTMLSAQTRDPVTAAASARLFASHARRGRWRAHRAADREADLPGQLLSPQSGAREGNLPHPRRPVPRPRARDDGGAADAARRRPEDANLVLILSFKSLKNICVDTHVHRISNRLGWVRTRTPEETEQALYKSTSARWWPYINLYLVTWGQNVCRPLYPRCGACLIREHCPQIGVTQQAKR
jgi:endonuclease-3